MTAIRVVLADDQNLVRAGMRSLLSAEPDIEVVGEAADGDHAMRVIREVRPTVVLMDIRMPHRDGLQATRDIAEDPHLGDVHVVILTTFELDEYVYSAIRAGAAGFLLKDAEPTELVRGVRVAAAGDALLSPAIARRLMVGFAAAPNGPPNHERARDLPLLTERERDIVRLVGHGLSNEEIARHRVISPATVRTHVSRSLLKTGSRDRAQLVVFAYETGLVTPGRGVGSDETDSAR